MAAQVKVIALLLAVIGAVPVLAYGDDSVVSDSQIEQALRPQPKTRGLLVRATT